MKQRTIQSRLGFLALSAGLAVVVAPAGVVAQVNVIKAPVSSTITTNLLPSGQRFEFCPGSFQLDPPPADPIPIPLEWVVVIENLSQTAPTTVVYDDIVSDGFNGNYLTLVCPPTLLPASVRPSDVVCNAATGQIRISNIVIPACGKETLRFRTLVSGDAGIQDVCNGGSVIAGTTTTRSESPLDDPRPSPPPSPSNADDTCFFVNPFCNMSDTKNVRQLLSIDDVNGPPLLPGDTVLVSAAIDLTWMDLLSNLFYTYFHFNSAVLDTPSAMPSYLNFVAWTSKPLEPGMTYSVWDATRRVTITDATPGPPGVPVPSLGVRELGTWQGIITCSAAPGVEQCLHGIGRFAGGFGIADDPKTYGFRPDDTCFTSMQPDFSSSIKTVSDADRSGDAQPGELLTFTVQVENGSICPPQLSVCECAGTGVQVNDVLDSRLTDINVLTGGTLVGPSEAQWNIGSLPSAGNPGSIQVVQVEARVPITATAGSTFCNTALVTSNEYKNVADGGKLVGCPTFPATRVDLAPCIRVVIPAVASLALDKQLAAGTPPGPYRIGTTLTYELTVTNVGGANASNVDVWDCLSPSWGSAIITPIGGTYTPAPAAGCPAGSARIDWPRIPTLTSLGGSNTVRFTAQLVPGMTDGTVIPNTATTNSPSIPAPVSSNQLSIEICAPNLVFTKTLDKTATPPALPVYGEGEDMVWTITVENTGGCEATQVQVSDTLDLAVLKDVPDLRWSPPTATKVGNTITWPVVPSIAAGGSQTFTITSQPRAGSAPGQVCNSAELDWFEGVTSISSEPGAGTCADILSGCLTLPVITPMLAVRAGTNVVMSWTAAPAAADGYRVCRIDGFVNKTDIPNACEGSVLASSVCDPVLPPTCTDTAVTVPPGGVFYYQVKGLCSGFEGP